MRDSHPGSGVLERAAAVLAALALVAGCGPQSVDVDLHEAEVGGVEQAACALARAPVGHLDRASGGVIAGWARDDDFPSAALAIHIYVDGRFYQALRANGYRADVGSHAFHWNYEGFGPGPGAGGTHEVRAYAIGVSCANVGDGLNAELSQSPRALRDDVAPGDGCGLLDGADELAWCQNPPYWQTRALDTAYVSHNTVRVGINKSYGGAIFQLFGAGHADDGTGLVWGRNLVDEHGGAAVQLSVYGYTPSGTYPSAPNECPGINLVPGGADPYNPIQAQGPWNGSHCGWNDSSLGSNNAQVACYVSSDATTSCLSPPQTSATFYSSYDNPFHFTRYSAAAGGGRAVGLKMEQWVTVRTGYAKVKYRLRYSGADTWTAHAQELPAIFAVGLNQAYHAYTGAAPFQNQPVTSLGVPALRQERFLRLRNYERSSYPHAYCDSVNRGAPCLYAEERWWGSCGSGDKRCLTVASPSTVIGEAAVARNDGATQGAAGYLTPLGGFNVYPGLDKTWVVYFFPYKYSQVVPGTGGKTARALIYELRNAGWP